MTDCSIHGAENVHQVLWPDADLESVEIEYDCVRIRVREPTGKLRLVKCLGYIGYKSLGVWDETIIETAILLSAHEFIDRCVDVISSRPGGFAMDSGSDDRNRRLWNMLSIVFIDGSELKVVMAGLSVETVD